jgi:peptidyl-tRNA hydrolase
MILYCIVSEEAVKAVKGNRGKLMAQAGHAYVDAIMDSMERYPEKVKAYFETGVVKKVCLKATDPAALRELHSSYRRVCGVKLVQDAGLTVFDGPTITCLGLGPIDPKDIKEDLSTLKVFI